MSIAAFVVLAAVGSPLSVTMLPLEADPGFPAHPSPHLSISGAVDSRTPALASGAAAPSARITVPHLSGIFVSLDNTTAARTKQDWLNDLSAMKKIGIEFFVVRSVASGCTPTPASPWQNACPPTSPAACPLGGFYLWFPRGSAPALSEECFPAGNTPAVDTIGILLEAASELNLGVHLGLGYPDTSRIPAGMNSTVYFQKLAAMNWDIAQQLWLLYGGTYGSGAGGTGTLQGFYTDVEESNSIGELALTKDLVGHYLEPLARDIHALVANATNDDSGADGGADSGVKVWASPYFVGNLSRHPSADYMNPRFYADWWGQVFVEAPHLDLIAPQDSMGAQGNSFENVSTYVTQMALISRQNGREIWSNVELFQVWPPQCQWSPKTGICKGRAPAPWARIKEQMANEYPLVDKLIAWEWHTCLSPYGNTNLTTIVYNEYLAYIEAGTTTN